MALWLWLLLVLTVLAVAIIFHRHHKESSTFPPGFPRYPLIGSLLSVRWDKVGTQVIVDSTRYASRYGKLMGYFVGPVNRCVIVQDFDLAKKMASNEVFSGRIVQPIFIQLRGIKGRQVGIMMTHGQTWKANRTFAMSTLREFGFGKKSIGSVITHEAMAVVDELRSQSGNDILIDQNFYIPIFNILWSMVASERFLPNDPHIDGFMKILSEIFKSIYLYVLFPWLKYFSPFRYNKFKQHYSSLKNMFRTIIKEHEEALSLDEKPRDFIEAYLQQKRMNPDLTEDDLVGVCMDLFEAGTDTVGTTLSWLVLYLALYPDVQEICYLELQAVLGTASPTLEDRPNLPYCEATIMEIQRMSCVAVTSLEHRALHDTTLDGFFIPEGTHLNYNIWKFHHDPEYFPDPWSFKPKRFLSSNGSSIVHNEHFVPYGFGKRVCMGVSLAKAELFLFFTIMVQALKVSAPRYHKAPSEDEAEAGITRTPLPFHVHITSR